MAMGGQGGTSIFGGNASPAIAVSGSNNPGNNAPGVGGGGSGAATNGVAANAAGGNGAAGFAIITEFCTQ
jgi:hypothetical protein